MGALSFWYFLSIGIRKKNLQKKEDFQGWLKLPNFLQVIRKGFWRLSEISTI